MKVADVSFLWSSKCEWVNQQHKSYNLHLENTRRKGLIRIQSNQLWFKLTLVICYILKMITVNIIIASSSGLEIKVLFNGAPLHLLKLFKGILYRNQYILVLPANKNLRETQENLREPRAPGLPTSPNIVLVTSFGKIPFWAPGLKSKCQTLGLP